MSVCDEDVPHRARAHSEAEGKEEEDDQIKFVPLAIPSILPVIITAIAIFLATNGPQDWGAIWRELIDPPPDARHAIRKPSPAFARPAHQQLAEQRRAQLMSYVYSVQQSLEVSVRDEQSRMATVDRIYAGLGLGQHRVKQVATLLEGLSMTSLKAHFTLLQRFADSELRTESAEMHAQFMERTTQFLDQLMALSDSTRNG